MSTTSKIPTWQCFLWVYALRICLMEESFFHDINRNVNSPWENKNLFSKRIQTPQYVYFYPQRMMALKCNFGIFGVFRQAIVKSILLGILWDPYRSLYNSSLKCQALFYVIPISIAKIMNTWRIFVQN
jgi:hypothetical protein